MKTKRKAIGSLLAASLVAIPSFFITSCEQDDGLGEYEMRQQYTLSRRMMGANMENSGNVGTSSAYILAGRDSATLSYQGRPIVKYDVHWREGYWEEITISSSILPLFDSIYSVKSQNIMVDQITDNLDNYKLRVWYTYEIYNKQNNQKLQTVKDEKEIKVQVDETHDPIINPF